MSTSIFSNGNKNEGEFKNKVDTQSRAILRVIERQKELESSIDLLNDKLELLDHNAIRNFKDIINDVKSIKSNSLEVKLEVSQIQEFNKKIKNQISLMTTKDEVSKLEKYIDLWNPMDFVTRDELVENNKKIIGKIMEIVESFVEEKEKN